jgi:hypothetical protein
MLWLYIILLVVILKIAHSLHIHRTNTKINTKPIDKLKNALLTYALVQVYTNKFDDANFNYSSFDGTRLPSMSGFSFENACFSYIIDKNEFKNSLMFSKPMLDKIIAIEKFLDTNLNTNDAVQTFFETFVKEAGKGE